MIDDTLLRSTEPRTGDPLLIYLAKNPKRALQSTILALINMAPPDVIGAKDARGQSALLCLAKRPQDSRLVDALLKRGANPNESDEDGCTVLMHCIKNTYSHDLIRFLCRNGVEINAHDQDHRTALHHAVLEQNCFIVPDLVAAGANKEIRDFDGKRPIDIALELAQARAEDVEQDPLVNTLRQSQSHMLDLLSKMFGERFGADLLKASTRPFEIQSNTVSYAVHMFGGSSSYVSDANAQIEPPATTARTEDTEGNIGTSTDSAPKTSTTTR